MAAFGNDDPASPFGNPHDSGSPFGDGEIKYKDCWRIITREIHSPPPQEVSPGDPIYPSPPPPQGSKVYAFLFKLKLTKQCKCLPRPRRPVCPGPPGVRNDNWAPWSAATNSGALRFTFYDYHINCEDCDRILGEHAGADDIRRCEPDFGPTFIDPPVPMVLIFAPNTDPKSPRFRALVQTTIDPLAGSMFNNWLDSDSLEGAEAAGYTESCCGGPNSWDLPVPKPKK